MLPARAVPGYHGTSPYLLVSKYTLAEKIHLNPPRPEAYTSTLIGPDCTVYAINNATLYAIGR